MVDAVSLELGIRSIAPMQAAFEPVDGDPAVLLRTEQNFPVDPTRAAYQALIFAFDFFNARLFEGRLLSCLFTFQRHRSAYGYFAGDRFGVIGGDGTADEIAMNPLHFADRSLQDVLSTLVHEMTHLEQHHSGKPGRSGYHNRQWAGLMRRVGLTPSHTGQPGGRQTGRRVSHFVQPGGPFDVACRDLMENGFSIPYTDLWGDLAGAPDTGRDAAWLKKIASKTPYICPRCQTKAWGRPGLNLVCGDCHQRLAMTTASQTAIARRDQINTKSGT